MSSRPEHLAPPDVYYNAEEAEKYTRNTRIIEIQRSMTERCVELLLLPNDVPCFLLDVGCGSGLSGSVLDEMGHAWVGMDISESMLNVALERETEGDLILSDMGDGVPFRAGSFDGAISVSALQWLCNVDKTHHRPVQRLYKFFSTLFASLSRNARAVFQFYPENSLQIELITSQAMKAGFFGGILVDYPNSTKAKKYFLVLMTGGSMPMPKALGDESSQSGNQISYTERENKKKNVKVKHLKKSRNWILEKKARRRRQGKDTRADTKYTGRKRSGKF